MSTTYVCAYLEVKHYAIKQNSYYTMRAKMQYHISGPIFEIIIKVFRPKRCLLKIGWVKREILHCNQLSVEFVEITPFNNLVKLKADLCLIKILGTYQSHVIKSITLFVNICMVWVMNICFYVSPIIIQCFDIKYPFIAWSEL